MIVGDVRALRTGIGFHYTHANVFLTPAPQGGGGTVRLFLFFSFDDTSTDQDLFLDTSNKFLHLVVLSIYLNHLTPTI